MPYLCNECAIIRMKDGLAAIFSDESGAVSIRRHDGKNWGSAEVIGNGITGKISANVSINGEIFVFCQDVLGSILLFHFDGKAWKKQLIQENLTGSAYNLKIYAIISSGGIHLLYNIPSKAADKTHYKIVSQEMSDGEWLPYVTAAENVADSNPVFTVQNIAENHYAIYYQTGSMETAFGYRELVLPSKWSGFTTLHQTLHSFSDSSVVTTSDAIHLAFILRGAYSSQLIYKNKMGPAVSAPTVLFEASRVDAVSLFIYKGDIHIIFSAGGYGFFSCVSKDEGKTFSRPVRIRSAGLNRLLKAEYVSGQAQTSGAAFSDVFSDAENPGAAPFLEEIYKDYYYAATSEQPASKTYVTQEKKPADDRLFSENAASFKTDKPAQVSEAPVKPVPNQPEARKKNADFEAENRETRELRALLNEKNSKIAIIENKLELSYREIAEKNRQIMELNTILSKKNEETANVAESYRETVRRLREEVEEKSKTISKMRERAAEAAARHAFPAAASAAEDTSEIVSESAPEVISETVAGDDAEAASKNSFEGTSESASEDTLEADLEDKAEEFPEVSQ